MNRTPLLLFPFFIFACTERAPEPVPAADPVPMAREPSVFDAFNRGSTPGVAVLAMQRGEIVELDGYGESELVAHRLITPDTLFNLASDSKQFTAAAVLMLSERGLVKLDQKLRTILPSLPAWADEITVAQLVFHTSGLPDYMSICDGDDRRPRTNQDVLGFLEASPALDFEPGTRFEYSNTGYAVLALVFEAVAHETLPSFIEREIFDHLGMTSTFLDSPDIREGGERRAVGHGAWPLFEVNDESACNYIYGDGSIYSSVRDYALWLRALDAPGLFSDAALKRIFTSGTLTSGESVEYGFGWRIQPYRGRDIYWHNGSWLGFHSAVVKFIEDDLWIAIFANSSEVDVDLFADLLAAPYLRPLVAP